MKYKKQNVFTIYLGKPSGGQRPRFLDLFEIELRLTFNTRKFYTKNMNTFINWQKKWIKYKKIMNHFVRNFMILRGLHAFLSSTHLRSFPVKVITLQEPTMH